MEWLHVSACEGLNGYELNLEVFYCKWCFDSLKFAFAFVFYEEDEEERRESVYAM